MKDLILNGLLILVPVALGIMFLGCLYDVYVATQTVYK